MFKIIKFSLIAVFLLSILSLEAQCVQFTYDAAGNRIQRKYDPICISAITAGGNDEFRALTNYDALSVREDIQVQRITRIYPNPTASVFIIETNTFGTSAQVTGYSSDGDIVYTNLLDRGTIDISQLPPGIYAILITEQQGENLIHYQQKIVKL